MPQGDALGLAGRMLLIAGLALAAVGAFLLLGGRLPFLGRLPGDVVWQRGNLKVYFPIATSIVLSVLLTLILAIISRFRH